MKKNFRDEFSKEYVDTTKLKEAIKKANHKAYQKKVGKLLSEVTLGKHKKKGY